MRVEFAPGTTSPGPALVKATPPRHGLDRFELGLLALFAALSMWVIALDLWQVVVDDRVWTGTDGFFIVDQMQYLAWIQSASHHLLVSNLFVLRATPSDYFQPAILLSGAIAALGVAPWLTLLLWKPVAVLGTFFAIRTYANRSLEGRGARRAALTLGLLFGSFSVVYGAFGIVGDMMPDFLSWGYPFGLIAVALIVCALLGYDRARAGRRVAWVPGLLGAAASTLHPWQGEVMIVIILLAELGRRREPLGARRLALPLMTIVLTGLPLLYYVVLGHLDLSWSLARDASKHTFSFGSIALGLAPLALFSILGYRGRPRSFLQLITRVWPLSALLIYFVSATGFSATPLHAFDGITLPLAVLAVDGVSRTRWQRIPRARLAGALAMAIATVPANVYALAVAPAFTAPTPGNANFITRGERAALTYLDRSPDPGGVLTQFYLGAVVPARTGRHTFVGDCLWSEPNCNPRAESAEALFDGLLGPEPAQTLVHESGARFLLSSCQPHADLEPVLGALITSIKHFGCATVYELVAPSAPDGPLAESPVDAVVRAPRRQ